MKSRRKIYSCSSCGGKCMVSCDGAPTCCVLGKGEEPNWKTDDAPKYEFKDEFRMPWVDDGEYISKLTDEEKDEIIRNHFDCKMEGGCPCWTDKKYKCPEFKAFCKLTDSDGKDFEFDDCWFRSNEHRCLTDYVLWRKRSKKKS